MLPRLQAILARSNLLHAMTARALPATVGIEDLDRPVPLRGLDEAFLAFYRQAEAEPER